MSTEQTQDTAAQDTPERTFHPNDYRKAASLLRSMRHVRNDPYTPKGLTSQARVNALAAAFASAFSQDAEENPQGTPFSECYFMEGTRLPEPPQDAPQDDAVADVLAELEGNPWGTDTASDAAPQS